MNNVYHTVVNLKVISALIIFIYITQHFPRGLAILSSGSAFTGGEASLPPRFISRGNTFRVVTGDTVSLPCEVQNLGSFVIVWRKGTTLLSAGQQMISRDTRLSLMGYNLQIRDIRYLDQGDYTCQIGDGTSGDLIHTIEILMPPSIQIVPPNGQTTTKKGGPVTFECRTNGNPPPIVQWSKKDGLLPSGMQVQTGYILSLMDVQRQHAGAYQCTASNGIGQAATAEIRLHVLYPPEVQVLRSWVPTAEGMEAKLDCVVHADPPAEVSWYQDSFPLLPTDRRTMVQTGLTHSLIIKSIQASDFGNYSCVVSNSIGREKKYMELSGKPGPPMITSPGYSNPYEYNLTWTVQSVFPIIEVRILYRRVLINSSYHHPGQWHDLLIHPAQSRKSTYEHMMSYAIRNLVPDSVYECLIQTKNKNGFGELSDLHQWFSSQKGRPLLQANAGQKFADHKLSRIIIFFSVIFCLV